MSIFTDPTYRYDEDLEFLGHLKSEDLNDLVHILTTDPSDGVGRFSEELTSNPDYKKYYPDHHKYWRAIAAEIQTFGANSIATIFRGGEGVLYKEVLIDVCDKLKVNYNKDSSTDTIENNLFMKVFTDAVEKMTDEEIKELGINLGFEKSEFITPELLTSGVLSILKAGGFKSYQIVITIANAVYKSLFGKGLSLLANSTIPKILNVAIGPIGWAVTVIWTTIDVAGPAYRVTVPAVFLVAALRRKYKSRS